MRPMLLAVFAFTVGLTMTGCSAPWRPAIYDGTQSERDRLPDVVRSTGNEAYDLDSARFLGTWEQFEFYAVREGDNDCVAKVGEAASDWAVSCGSGGGLLSFQGAGVAGQFAVNGFPKSSTPDGWVSVHPSLRIAEEPGAGSTL